MEIELPMNTRGHTKLAKISPLRCWIPLSPHDNVSSWACTARLSERREFVFSEEHHKMSRYVLDLGFLRRLKLKSTAWPEVAVLSTEAEDAFVVSLMYCGRILDTPLGLLHRITSTNTDVTDR